MGFLQHRAVGKGWNSRGLTPCNYVEASQSLLCTLQGYLIISFHKRWKSFSWRLKTSPKASVIKKKPLSFPPDISDPRILLSLIRDTFSFPRENGLFLWILEYSPQSFQNKQERLGFIKMGFAGAAVTKPPLLSLI